MKLLIVRVAIYLNLNVQRYRSNKQHWIPKYWKRVTVARVRELLMREIPRVVCVSSASARIEMFKQYIFWGNFFFLVVWFILFVCLDVWSRSSGREIERWIEMWLCDVYGISEKKNFSIFIHITKISMCTTMQELKPKSHKTVPMYTHTYTNEQLSWSIFWGACESRWLTKSMTQPVAGVGWSWMCYDKS